jgi:hypothetical protein
MPACDGNSAPDRLCSCSCAFLAALATITRPQHSNSIVQQPLNPPLYKLAIRHQPQLTPPHTGQFHAPPPPLPNQCTLNPPLHKLPIWHQPQLTQSPHHPTQARRIQRSKPRRHSSQRSSRPCSWWAGIGGQAAECCQCCCKLFAAERWQAGLGGSVEPVQRTRAYCSTVQVSWGNNWHMAKRRHGLRGCVQCSRSGKYGCNLLAAERWQAVLRYSVEPVWSICRKHQHKFAGALANASHWLLDLCCSCCSASTTRPIFEDHTLSPTAADATPPRPKPLHQRCIKYTFGVAHYAGQRNSNTRLDLTKRSPF